MTKIDRPEVQDRMTVMDDEKKRALDLYDLRLVPPGVGIFDEPTRCYKINKQWAAYVMGMVSWLAEVAPWRDAENEGYLAILEILKFLVGDECEMPFQLRQNPTNTCLLEQSLDGGATWSTVFDYSLCATIQDKSYQVQIQNSVTYVQQTFQDIYNNFTANYAGNPESVYPNLADPAGDDSALRAAYCNALFELVRVACDTAVSYYTETINSQQNEVNVGLGITAFILAVISLAAAVPTAGASLVGLAGAAGIWAAAIGVGGVLGNALVDYWQQHTIDQFQDQAAMEDVTCYLFEEVPAADNSLAAMQAALASHPLTDNAAVIADFLSILFQHDSTYAAFLEKWDNNKEFADAGIELYCPCLTGYQVWVWDFSNGLGEFTIENGELSGGRLVGTDTGFEKSINIRMPFNPSWRVRACKLHGERVNGIAHGTGDEEVVRFRPTANSNTGAYGFPQGGHRGNGVFARCAAHNISPFWFDGINQVHLHASVTDNATSQIYIDKIEIQFVENFAKGGYITDDDNICV